MSWFFGKKKHKESPTESADEATSSSQADDYIIIEKQANPFAPSPTSSTGGPSGGPNGGLYPFIGGGMVNPPSIPAVPTQSTGISDTQSYLSGIPFELDKKFENDGEIDRIHVDEIFAFVLRVKSEEYEYDFGLEKSVITEMEASAD